MRIGHLNVRVLAPICATVLIASALASGNALAQMKSPGSNPLLRSEQQKQLDRLHQLDDQLQKDRDEVQSAVAQHGWDSDEADAAQQRLLRDRREYRDLRRSLQNAGVNIPSGPPNTDARHQNGQAGHHCCSHGQQDCCDGDVRCAHHHDDGCCGRHGS